MSGARIEEAVEPLEVPHARSGEPMRGWTTYPYVVIRSSSATGPALEWLVLKHDTLEKRRNPQWTAGGGSVWEKEVWKVHIHVQLPQHRPGARLNGRNALMVGVVIREEHDGIDDGNTGKVVGKG